MSFVRDLPRLSRNPAARQEKFKEQLRQAESDGVPWNIFLRLYSLPAWPAELPDGNVSGELLGASFAVKDNIAVQGAPMSCGMSPPCLACSEKDSAVVEFFRRRGAFLLGSTSLDECSLGLSGCNRHTGRIRNPRRPKLSVLGSSGGSAAAVAAGMVDFSLGTDSGGSVRAPAAACGIWGLRCGSEFLPREGSALLRSPLDSLGFLCDSLEGLEFVCRLVKNPAAGAPQPTFLVPGAKELKILAPEVDRSFNDLCACLGSNVGAVKNELGFSRALELRKFLLAEPLAEMLEQYGLKEKLLPPAGRALMELWRKSGQSGRDSARRQAQELKKQLQSMLHPGTFILTPVLPGNVPGLEGPWPGDAPLNFYLALANVCDLPAVAGVVDKGGAGEFYFQLIGPAESEINTLTAAGTMLKRLQIQKIS